MLGLSLPSRGARRRRRRRLRRLLRQRQISTLWATTYQPERYEKCLYFRASTRKRNTKWFVVNISNRDDDNDNDNDNDWTKKLRLSPISRKKCDCASSLVCVDSTIYCLGGFYRAPKCYNNRPTKDVLCLDASSPSPRWKSIVSMNVGRTGPTTVVVNGKLYVMGGNLIINPAKDTETDRWAEVFDPHTKKWSFLPKPPDDLLPLGDNLVMCLGLEDLHKIMVTPYNSSKQAYLYDISQNIWTSKHHVDLCPHRFVSRVDNKDTAVFGNTLYWYDKNYRSVNAYEWETGNLLSGRLKGLGTAGWKMEDIRVQKDIYLFHLSGKLFCLVWNEELSSTVHCSKFVVDKSCYSHDNCNGSLCAWVLSSQDYYLGHNTTLYDAALMNTKCVVDSAGKVRCDHIKKLARQRVWDSPTEVVGKLRRPRLMASHRSTPRTPSGKGKRQQAYHKATWDEESTQILLQLVVKEIEAGNRPHMSITPNGYRSLSKTFEAATGRLHSLKQLKNKYNLLKTEWRAWCKLMDCRKGPTGIGFDQETGLFNASADWWAKMEKIDSVCCKFRTKSLDHPELMERVFTGAAATGKNAWTPGETRNPMELDEESDSPEFSGDSNDLGASEMAAMMNSAHLNATGSGTKRKHSSGKSLQNKRVSGAEALAGSMDELLNSVKTQSKELTVNHVIGGHSVTMGQAVGRLYEIQGLAPENELLHFGVMLMEVPNNREMVMSIPTDQGIIGWLRAKKQDKDRSGGVTLASLLRNEGVRF